jgi:DNA polymerase-3 subunit delta'
MPAMARAPLAQTDSPRDPDALDDIPLPRERMVLIGHTAAERELLDAYRSGRIHHGWILGGPEGIGKATLAFRFARFLLAQPDPTAPAVRAAQDLSLPADHPVAHRVNAGAHVDLTHLRRPWDEKNKRFKSELTVDEVRRAVSFFGSTAGAGGWRVCIVDTADDMNSNAANALLKVLEEPPQRAIFLVLSHQPGRLLPTIRSRCRRLTLSPLTDQEVLGGLAGFGLTDGLDEKKRGQLLALAEGSLRRAVMAMTTGALQVAERVEGLIDRLPRLDPLAIHALADKLTLKDAEDDFRLAQSLILDAAASRARFAALAGDLMRGARWADTRSAIEKTFAEMDIYNLDKRAAILSAFQALVEASAN